MLRGGNLRVGIENAEGESFVTPRTIPRFNDSKWHYAIATYDESVLNLYADGKQVLTKQTFGAVPDNTGSQPLRIGANSLSPEGFFIGNVDEVRIWDRALTSLEVQNAFLNNGFGLGEQVLYMPFDKEQDNSEQEEDET